MQATQQGFRTAEEGFCGGMAAVSSSTKFAVSNFFAGLEFDVWLDVKKRQRHVFVEKLN